jgi:GntR family transcriptional regulator
MLDPTPSLPSGQAPRLRLLRDEEPPPYEAMPDPSTRRETFAVIPVCAFERLKGDGFALAVYVCLAKHADREGVCWPSVRSLGGLTGWSESTVKRAIKRLVASGMVEVERRTTKEGDADTNRFTLVYHPLQGGSTQNPPPIRQTPPGVPTEPRGGFPQNHELDPRELDPIEQQRQQPAASNGFRPQWPTILGDRFPKVQAKFAKLSAEFTGGMFRTMLIEAERDVGVVPETALVAGLQAAWSALERQMTAERNGAKPIANLKPYARSIVVTKVREASSP